MRDFYSDKVENHLFAYHLEVTATDVNVFLSFDAFLKNIIEVTLKKKKKIKKNSSFLSTFCAISSLHRPSVTHGDAAWDWSRRYHPSYFLS